MLQSDKLQRELRPLRVRRKTRKIRVIRSFRGIRVKNFDFEEGPDCHLPLFTHERKRLKSTTKDFREVLIIGRRTEGVTLQPQRYMDEIIKFAYNLKNENKLP